MKTALLWFKTDLRLHDNETLCRALGAAEQIVPVYCFDPAHTGATGFGTLKTGLHRAAFIRACVADLQDQLRERGSDLVIVEGNPATCIPQLAQEYGAQAVFAKREVAYEEKETDEAVERALWAYHIPFDTFSTSTLYLATDLPFSIREIPDNFTEFRKKIERNAPIREPRQTPEQIPSPPINTQGNVLLEKAAPYSVDPRTSFPFTGGETAALNRLQYYLYESRAISTYKLTRNELSGSDFSSKLSPWLAQGCISPRQIYKAVKAFEASIEENESTYWLIFELLWRDFFRFMFKKYQTRYFYEAGIRFNKKKRGKAENDAFDKWKSGTTGNDLIDAFMRELSATGFMSNRGRQIVASYLCNDLHVDWRYGAAWFEEHLIDYDVCSNWGNWAYIAGVGNDPRDNRYFNIDKQASLYDADHSFRNRWLTSTLSTGTDLHEKGTTAYND